MIPSFRRLAATALLVAGGAAVEAPGARGSEVRFEAPAPAARERAILVSYAETVRIWAMVQRVAEAVIEQNSRQVPLERVQEIAGAWAEGREPEELTRELATNECARALQSVLAANTASITAFAVDGQGALVCMTSRVSSYWLWQDPRWYAAFDDGRGALFVSKEVEDEATEATVRFVSAPVVREGRAVGVLVVGRLARVPDL